MSYSELIIVYNEENPIDNVLVPLTLKVETVVFLTHHNVDGKKKDGVFNTIQKYSSMSIVFKKIKDIEEIDETLNNYPTAVVDPSGCQYLSMVLFEKTIGRENAIIYYDEEENLLKTYRQHKVLNQEVFRLTIEDLINIGGGELKSHLHKSPVKNEKISNEIIIRTVDTNLNRYPDFINHITQINSMISKNGISGTISHLSEEQYSQLIKDPTARLCQEVGIYYLDENRNINFPDKKIVDAIRTSGIFLEAYLYLKLKKHNAFDDVIMSAIIDFQNLESKRSITCEIDGLVLKDNRLLFVSCKSNKIDQKDIYEIKILNNQFGNRRSKAVICTLVDLNIKEPSIYAKSRECDVAVVDKTAFEQNTLEQVFLDICLDTYKYEKID